MNKEDEILSLLREIKDILKVKPPTFIENFQNNRIGINQDYLFWDKSIEYKHITRGCISEKYCKTCNIIVRDSVCLCGIQRCDKCDTLFSEIPPNGIFNKRMHHDIYNIIGCLEMKDGVWWKIFDKDGKLQTSREKAYPNEFKDGRWLGSSFK